MASKDYRHSAVDRMRDPYEAYYRHVRRRDRADVTAILSGILLALLLVSAIIFFCQAEFDQRVAAADRDNVALNN